MKLLGVEKKDNWLYSEWQLTYHVGWKRILSAAELLFEYMRAPEVLAGDAYCEKTIAVKEAKDVMAIEERGSLTIRGGSEILNVPIMITFYNQSDMVRLYVPCATEEFAEADYREFNLSMCQFMDSAEIAMYG
ncbi:MAG: hypothetical protein II700_06235 [Firmicutes bacterium]|nr:hypothetical protein [Bacillota bacterium]MBQ4234477.1 hypothetical protein [Bacillota bacterium]MBQ6012560.1 hypothetical protein [Bacillota bacterium]MBR0114249.1 hypothetical protein [Bacillota bacterium]MBR0440843.1 hypothetical protein [Bacillota bacterium]